MTIIFKLNFRCNINDSSISLSGWTVIVLDGYDFVAYPNRNSVPFREFYKIPEAHTVIRGSLRYEGNPAFVKALIDLGWLDIEQKDWLKDGLTWLEIFQKMTGVEGKDESALITVTKEVCKFTSEVETNRMISGLRWIGLLSDEKATITGGNLLDTLWAQLQKLMSFQAGERDLDVFTSTLELLGNPTGYSSMSLFVGITCGIATQLLLDGHPALNVLGVLAPYTVEICDVIRERIEREGVMMVEKQIS